MTLKQLLDRIAKLNLTDEQLEDCKIHIQVDYYDNYADPQMMGTDRINDIVYDEEDNIIIIEAED